MSELYVSVECRFDVDVFDEWRIGRRVHAYNKTWRFHQKPICQYNKNMYVFTDWISFISSDQREA